MDPEEFRGFFGAIPAAVAVVTTVEAGDTPRGLTCSASSAVSAEPPLLLVCLDRHCRTVSALLSRRAFVLHLLAEDGADTARVFAGRSPDKFAQLPYPPGRPPGCPSWSAAFSRTPSACRRTARKRATTASSSDGWTRYGCASPLAGAAPAGGLPCLAEAVRA
ncbi:flavin reductase family protein [Streptomyces sp. LN785]|uniref:flavin reductase family protein n=1 Tax=Streptomyces sp. LN785 TaxID=3112983 RepID=UPI00371BFD76